MVQSGMQPTSAEHDKESAYLKAGTGVRARHEDERRSHATNVADVVYQPAPVCAAVDGLVLVQAHLAGSLALRLGALASVGPEVAVVANLRHAVAREMHDSGRKRRKKVDKKRRTSRHASFSPRGRSRC